MLGCAMLNVLYFMSYVLPVKPYAESKFFDIIVLLVVLAKHNFLLLLIHLNQDSA